MPAYRTPLATHFMRLTRLALHVARGLAIVWLHFPRLSANARHAAIRRWSRTLLAIVATRHMRVQINFLTPIAATGATRRPLAEQSATAIAAALGVRRPRYLHMAPKADAYPADTQA